MQHGYIITLELTNTALVGLIFLFMIYNFLLVQLAPHIKKYLGCLFDIIVKRDKRIGFK